MNDPRVDNFDYEKVRVSWDGPWKRRSYLGSGVVYSRTGMLEGRPFEVSVDKRGTCRYSGLVRWGPDPIRDIVYSDNGVIAEGWKNAAVKIIQAGKYRASMHPVAS